MIDQALISGSSFLFTITAAKCLVMSDFGVFGLAWTTLLFCSGIHQSLILQPLAVLYAEYAPGPANAYLRTLERFHVWIFLVAIPAILAAWLLPAWGGLIAATVLAAVLRQAAEHERRVAYARHDGPRALLISCACTLPLVIAAAWFWINPTMLSCEIIMSAAAAPAAMGWIVGRMLLRQSRDSSDKLSPSPAHAHWTFGKWVLVSTLAQYAGNQAYPFLIAGMLGLREVAALTLMRSIVGITNVFASGIEAWWTPRARKAFVTGGWAALSHWKRRLELGFLIGISSTLALCCLCAEPLIRHIAPSDYADYAWLLQTLALVWGIGLWSRIDAMVLQAMKRPQSGTLSNAIAAAFTISIGPALVAHAGLYGVVAGFLTNVVISKSVLSRALTKETRCLHA
ncbi:MAG: hypothetical protein J0M02_03350 [Planctomycetes bacterium]|nr:hypothetical protein [Planctomycetota bacterium]